MKKLLCRGLAAIALLAGPSAAMAQSVLVKAHESGQGATVSNGQTCFVITPLHVIKQMLGPGDYAESEDDSFTVIDSNGVRATATIRQEFRDADLVLGEIAQPGKLLCPNQWATGAQLGQTLKLRTPVVINNTGERRTVSAMDAVVREMRGDREFAVQTSRAADQLQKGMSGSVVELNGEPAGMLLSVDTGRQLGIVLRQDYINMLLGSAVTPPRDTRIVLGVMPFTDRGRASPVGNAALNGALGAVPRVRAVHLAQQAGFTGTILVGNLVSTVSQRTPNPNYVRPTNNNSGGILGAILKNALKSGGDTASRNIITYTFQISWKLVQPNGAILSEDIDRQSLSIGDAGFQRGVTDSQMLEQAVQTSAQRFLSAI